MLALPALAAALVAAGASAGDAERTVVFGDCVHFSGPANPDYPNGVLTGRRADGTYVRREFSARNAWSVVETPTMNTAYAIGFSRGSHGVTPSTSNVSVRPRIVLTRVSAQRGVYTVTVTAARSFAGRRVTVERLQRGAWTAVKRVVLGPESSARFSLGGRAPVRAALAASEAGPAYVAGVSNAVPRVRGATPRDAAIVAKLRRTGLPMCPEDPISQPFFTVQGRLFANPGGPVQVFEFAGTKAARAAAGTVSPDGSNFRRGRTVIHIDWAAPPHFFRRARWIVLYLGEDRATLAALRRGLGKQFAGR